MIQARRRADAARNDDLLLDAALELLREKGPDRISALDLARLANLTTGAVYARYENNEEILVGLWQHRISGPMRAFFDASLHAFQPGPDRHEAQTTIAKTISNPNGPLRPGIALMIASSRIPELHEIIIPEVQSWLRDFEIADDRTDVASLQKLGIISFVLGCLHYAAADMFDFSDWEAIKPLAHYGLAHPSVEGAPEVVEHTIGPILVETDNPVRDSLINGAARVLARGGLERATTQRIARAAALSPSVLFAEYRTRQALFNDVAQQLLQAIYREARATETLDSVVVANSTVPTSFDDSHLVAFRHEYACRAAAVNQGLVSPQGREQRRIRLEFHLAAITDADIKSALHEADLNSTTITTRQLSRSFGFSEHQTAPMARMAQVLSHGLILVEEFSDFIHDRDLRCIYQPLAEAFSLHIVDNK